MPITHSRLPAAHPLRIRCVGFNGRPCLALVSLPRRAFKAPERFHEALRDASWVIAVCDEGLDPLCPDCGRDLWASIQDDAA